MDKKYLKKITAYKCKWCGKIYIRPTHNCKFDPEKTNCLSCKKCLGVEKEDGFLYFDCSNGIHPAICEVADGQYAESTNCGNRRYKMSCVSYECLENYDGSKTYAEHLAEEDMKKWINKPW